MDCIRNLQQQIEKRPVVLGVGPQIYNFLPWESGMHWNGHEGVTASPWLFETNWIPAGETSARLRIRFHHLRGRLPSGYETDRRYEICAAFNASNIDYTEVEPLPDSVNVHPHPDISPNVYRCRIHFNYPVEAERWNGEVLNWRAETFKLDLPFIDFYYCDEFNGKFAHMYLIEWLSQSRGDQDGRGGRIESGGKLASRRWSELNAEAPGSIIKE